MKHSFFVRHRVKNPPMGTNSSRDVVIMGQMHTLKWSVLDNATMGNVCKQGPGRGDKEGGARE